MPPLFIATVVYGGGPCHSAVPLSGPTRIAQRLEQKLRLPGVPVDDIHRRIHTHTDRVVVGHRIWREADRKNTERFIGVEAIQFVHSAATTGARLRLDLDKAVLRRYSVTRSDLLH